MSGIAQLFVLSFLIFAVLVFYIILKERIKREIKERIKREIKDEGLSYIEELEADFKTILAESKADDEILNRININLASLRHFIEELDD